MENFIFITLSLCWILFWLYIDRLKIFVTSKVVHNTWYHRYSLLPLPVLTGKSDFLFKIRFTEDSKYEVEDEIAGNKIFGFTTSIWDRHHKNSVRFIWRYVKNKNNGEYQIGIRSYINGKTNNQYFTKQITVGKYYYLRMFHVKGVVTCLLESADDTFSEVPQKIEVQFEKVSKYKWLLFPFFGGKSLPNKKVTYELKYIC